MKETDGQKQPERRRKPDRSAAGIGTVRVFFNPGPDAEDRLRRLASLLISYATQDGFLAAADGEAGAPQEGSPPRGEPEAGH